MDFQTVINLSDKTSWHTWSTCCRRHCDPAVGVGRGDTERGLSVCLSEKSGEGDPRITTWKGEKSKEFYLQKDHLSLETIKVRSRCLVPSSVSLISSPRVWRSQSGGCANVEKPKKGAFPIRMAYSSCLYPHAWT